jgi:hypothetical protein
MSVRCHKQGLFCISLFPAFSENLKLFFIYWSHEGGFEKARKKQKTENFRKSYSCLFSFEEPSD